MFKVLMENCLHRGDAAQLVSLLRREGLTTTTVTRLDILVTKDLCGSHFSRVLVVLKSLMILSENRNDLQTLLSLGLTAKVLLWFEAVADLLTSDLHRGSAPLLSLTEVMFDYFLMLGQDSLPVSQLSVVLLQLAQFTLEPEINFPLRLQSIKTFNSIVESLSREQRREIQNENNQILSQVAAAVLTVGDYELQASLSEVLCRLTPRRERQQRANQWFSNRDISDAFCDIRDAEFEVDCRRFLNFVNCYHGDQRRVYTFPCLRAFLSSTQLFAPKDDKLDEFWIDFNVGSGCVSFFIDEPQGFLWGSIHLLKEDVDHYSLQDKDDETVLSVQLNNPIMHQDSRGQTVELSFSCGLHRELEEAAGRVFMKVQRSPHPPDGGPVQASPSAGRLSGRSYSRKKAPSKSQLRILPLSPPRSEEDFAVLTLKTRNRGEILFDQIRNSTPTTAHSGFQVNADLTDNVDAPEAHLSGSTPPDSGVPECVELQVSKEFRRSHSPSEKVFRKREVPDSGYLSDQTEGTPVHKRRVEPQQEGEESNSALTGVEPTVESQFYEGAEPVSDIMASIRTFRAEQEQYFTGSWHRVEAEVLHSLNKCHQNVSSLLNAVHQHRLSLLQSFESSVSDQLTQLEENSTNLNSINTQFLSLFQSEMQRLCTFCNEHLHRLKSLKGEKSGAEHRSSQ
ncbi:synaptonemal complex protein 2-like isoform X2 [Amphiprion ocellaris]|uniref:synaptonemal complex protein 2-like isoform X2 n=1 Tax=Amphiprion ocellaris TaxID=80972 RepID=UPI00241182F8|nr:synaptonemal complex protein 2-like isoform X2 [Amphiprion ocellaris]